MPVPHDTPSAPVFAASPQALNRIRYQRCCISALNPKREVAGAWDGVSGGRHAGCLVRCALVPLAVWFVPWMAESAGWCSWCISVYPFAPSADARLRSRSACWGRVSQWTVKRGGLATDGGSCALHGPGPCALSALLAASHCFALRATMKTCAPLITSPRAIIRPMPRLPPATWFSSGFGQGQDKVRVWGASESPVQQLPPPPAPPHDHPSPLHPPHPRRLSPPHRSIRAPRAPQAQPPFLPGLDGLDGVGRRAIRTRL